MSAKYYIRPRREENPKKWAGPFDVAQLKDLAVRRLFSKDLHEYSEDRSNWISARQIWGALFPTGAAMVVMPAPPVAVADVPVVSEQCSVEEVAAVPTPVEELPEWYLASNGQQHGPFSMTDLRTLAAQGKIQGGDLLWNPSFGEEWVEVQNVPALSSASTVEELPQIDTNAGQSPKTPPFALASLVLGLLGISILCGLGSVLAIVFGHLALINYRRPQRSQTGKWMAITGLVLGYLELVLILIVAIIGLVFWVSRR